MKKTVKNFALSRFSFVALIIGMVFGCSLVYMLQDASSTSQQMHWASNLAPGDVDTPFESAASNSSGNQSTDRLANSTDNSVRNDRLLCWVMTSPDHHQSRAKAVKETWGKRCDILLFMSTAEDADLPAIKLAVNEGRNQLWGKTREAYRYVWKHYHDKADWFFKADDDTYVIVENLRYFLAGFNSSDPMWFGYKFNTVVKQGYFSGGAGYVLSTEATKRFVEEGYFNALLCRHDHEGAEDAEMGKCMSNLNVSAMDTRDSKGRGRFFPFSPDSHLFPGKVNKDYWFWTNMYYPIKESDGVDMECCSDTAISFHYISEQQMYLLEYLIYLLRPFGMGAEKRPATPDPPPDFALTATPWSIAADPPTTPGANDSVTLPPTSTHPVSAATSDHPPAS